MSDSVETAAQAVADTFLTHCAIYCLALSYDREEFRLLARKAEDKKLDHMAKEYHQRADLAAGLHHAVTWQYVEDADLISQHWEPLLGAVVRREAYELVEAARASQLLVDKPDDEVWRGIWVWERDRAERNAARLAEMKAALTRYRDAVRESAGTS